MNIDEIKEKIRRKAIIMQVGGFRPPESPLASWFGKVTVALPGEDWPQSESGPMFALCQINVTELPFRPPRLEDIEFITVFIDSEELPMDEPNGSHWCLRAYKDISLLAPLEQKNTGSHIKPFPMRPEIIEADYPCHEDIPIDLPEDVDENYYEMFQNSDGLKIGGWPSLVQAEIFWAPYQRHPAQPEYVFQIDTNAKANWMWADRGVGYFGRGTAEGRLDEWAIEWQCY